MQRLPIKESIGLSALLLALVLSSHAQAGGYVGDLVYCDLDANGIFDGDDYGMDGVEVDISCSSGGEVCAEGTATTGTLHDSVDAGAFDAMCSGLSGWDSSGDLSGRFAMEILDSGCAAVAPPWLCTVTVDESTLPSGCDGLVTPRADGMPVDENMDGDHCDLEDGPFPEDQPIGDNGTYELCEAFASPAPTNGSYTALLTRKPTSCSLYADFAYTPTDVEIGATRTPRWWRRHPEAVEQFLPIEFCGETVTDICEAVELTRVRGFGLRRGLRRFTRHALAGQLNCDAFGCPDEIRALIDTGSAACAEHDRGYPYRRAGRILREYNQSATDIATGIHEGDAVRNYCRRHRRLSHDWLHHDNSWLRSMLWRLHSSDH